MKDDSRNIKRVLYLVLTFAVLLSCSYPVTTIEDRELKFEFKRTSEGLPDYESMLSIHIQTQKLPVETCSQVIRPVKSLSNITKLLKTPFYIREIQFM